MEIEKVGPKLPIECPMPEFNREEAFLVYAQFTGDAEKTAHCLGISPVDVLRAADELGWATQLQEIFRLKKSTRPGDFERGLNRAQNFAQCFKMRRFIERVLTKLTGLNDNELEDYIFNESADKNGDKTKKLTTRAIADLTSALEKCHSMTYAALGDTAQDRARRKEQATSDDDSSAGELNVQIANALGKLKSANNPRALLLEAQISVAAAKAKPPADDAYVPDEH